MCKSHLYITQIFYNKKLVLVKKKKKENISWINSWTINKKYKYEGHFPCIRD